MDTPKVNTQRPEVITALATSLGAGLLLAGSIRLNATLGTYVGPLEATFLVNLIGTLFAVALTLNQINRQFARALTKRPFYELGGGLLGIVMVLISNWIVPELGTTLSVSLFIGADLFFSSLTDHFGWLGFQRISLSYQRVAGLLLTLAGILLIKWG